MIFLALVLGEVPDRGSARRQCYAALKPRVLLSITEFFPDPHYQSRRTVQRLAEAAGFRLRAMHGRWYFFTANFLKPRTDGVGGNRCWTNVGGVMTQAKGHLPSVVIRFQVRCTREVVLCAGEPLCLR